MDELADVAGAETALVRRLALFFGRKIERLRRRNLAVS